MGHPHATFRFYFEQNLGYRDWILYEIAFWQMAYTRGASDRA